MLTRTKRTGGQHLPGDNGLQLLLKPERLAHLTHKSGIWSHSLKATVETTEEEEFTHVQEFRFIPKSGSEDDFPSDFLIQSSDDLFTFHPDEGKSRNG